MPKEIIISVIIPVYNAEAYIDACLKSVLEQRNASFEVVLVNDGSTDGTTSICRKWGELYQNLVYLEQKNQGQGTARNVAIAHAIGKWLVFLDADDTMEPNALEHLERSITDELDMVCYGWVFVSRDKEMVFVQLPPRTKKKEKIMQEAISVLWDKMIRKEFWDQEKINLSDQYGEDICPVYTMLVKARKISTLQIPLVCHFDREDNLSSHPSKILQVVQSVADTLEVFKMKGLFEENKYLLFLMLEKQHRHYKNLWEIEHIDEEKVIVERLETLAEKYFPREYSRIFCTEGEAIVIIGGIGRWHPSVLENWNIYYYDSLEHYLVDENKIKDIVCYFIIYVENEIKSVIGQIRTEEWALSYWKMQCLEFQKMREIQNIKGHIGLFCEAEKENDLLIRFEAVAQNLCNSVQLHNWADFWGMIAGHVKKRVLITKIDMNSIAEMSPNYRWEYMRLDKNVNLLSSWLCLRQRGISLEKFFLDHGYSNIAIYGIGYLGKLLISELQGSTINIDYLIDCNVKREMGYPVYSLERLLPETDIIVVSVLHLYGQIRAQLQLKTKSKVVSLQEVVDWI